jgi:hypothetical protein
VTTLAYAASFLALAGVTGFAATRRGSWLARLPLLAATPVLAIAVWWQLSQESGWPHGGKPLNGSVFVAGVVESPTPTDRGAIYLWAQPPGTTTPRSFKLPYSMQLEQQVANAARAAKKGGRVAIRASANVPKRKSRGSGGDSNASLLFHFYKLPPAGMQEKAGE